MRLRVRRATRDLECRPPAVRTASQRRLCRRGVCAAHWSGPRRRQPGDFRLACQNSISGLSCVPGDRLAVGQPGIDLRRCRHNRFGAELVLEKGRVQMALMSTR